MGITFSTTDESGGSLNVLVYGRSGIGKTRLIRTCPKPLIVSSEDKLISLKGLGIPVIHVKTVEDLDEAHTLITTDKKFKKYKTICMDSISDIAESSLNGLKKTHKDNRQAYGENNDRISEVIRKFRDMDRITYMIAKSQIYENAMGLQATRPSMPGKGLTNDMDYFFDEVFYLDENIDNEDKPFLFLRTKSTPTIDAKDSSGKLKHIEKPDMAYIFKKLNA